MEHKVGEIITVNVGYDVKVQITEVTYGKSRDCMGCIFQGADKCSRYKKTSDGHCTSNARTDGKNIIFKQVGTETKETLIENIKNIIRTKGRPGPTDQYFLDVAGHAVLSEVHLDGNTPDKDNSHHIDCCDIDTDGDFYVIFTDCSERFYEYDFSVSELQQILKIISEQK